MLRLHGEKQHRSKHSPGSDYSDEPQPKRQAAPDRKQSHTGGAGGSADPDDLATGAPATPLASTTDAGELPPPLDADAHAQLVQQLEQHMVTYQLSQKDVTTAAQLSSGAQLCIWLGRAASRQSAEKEKEYDTLIAAYLESALDNPPVLPPAKPQPDPASAITHAQLVERLEQHMEANQLSQKHVVAAAKLPYAMVLSMWLGRNVATLSAQRQKEIDTLVAAYLEGAGSNPPPKPIPPPKPDLTPATTHAQLVQRLEQHMEANQLSQKEVSAAVQLAAPSQLSIWLGRTSSTQTAEKKKEIDALIAAYLNDDAKRVGGKKPVPPPPTPPPPTPPPPTPRPPPTAATYNHTQLVQLLKQHMGANQLTQAAVSEAADLRGSSRDGHLLSSWLNHRRAGSTHHKLPSEKRKEVSRHIAAYLQGVGVNPSTLADSSEPLPDGSYAVSFLLDERWTSKGVSKSKRQFRVRWVGYSPEDDTCAAS